MIELKDFREINNLTQSELAKFLGVGNSFISQVEKGKSNLPENQFTKLLNNTNGWDTTPLVNKHSNNNTSAEIVEAEEVQAEEVSLAAIPIVPPAIVDLPNVLLHKDIEMNSSDYEKLNLERIIREVDIAYRVQTEKLAPYVNIGDILLLKQLKGDEEVRSSELHLINTRHEGTFLRYTFNEGDEYRLSATNRAPECRIPKSKVTEVFLIICNISFSIAMPDYLANKQLRQQGKQINTLVDSINNLVTATLDEGKRTDKVLQMLEKQIEINVKNNKQ